MGSPRGCAAVPLENGAACDEGEPCTDAVCSDGVCGLEPTLCDDGNACTRTCARKVSDASSIPFQAHARMAMPAPAGIHGLGVCAGGVKLDCDDGNDCTTDTCDDVTGCVHVPNAGFQHRQPCTRGFAQTGLARSRM